MDLQKAIVVCMQLPCPCMDFGSQNPTLFSPCWNGFIGSTRLGTPSGYGCFWEPWQDYVKKVIEPRSRLLFLDREDNLHTLPLSSAHLPILLSVCPASVQTRIPPDLAEEENKVTEVAVTSFFMEVDLWEQHLFYGDLVNGALAAQLV